MATAKEFTIRLEDRPGTLGKAFRGLADKGINIVAFQASTEGTPHARIVVDDPDSAKKIFDSERLNYTENQVAQITLPHRPGQLARVASRLGEAKININHAYAGIEPGTNAPLLFFGVADANQAVRVLEEVAAAAAAR